jgi:hypothetical protein
VEAHVNELNYDDGVSLAFCGYGWEKPSVLLSCSCCLPIGLKHSCPCEMRFMMLKLVRLQCVERMLVM